ncbi:MAG: ABC transporter ATP-binding protein [Bryobacteraceae bacterium]
MNLLCVQKLRISYSDGKGNRTAVVRGIDLHIAAGEIVGILGESGSGKSTLALSILRLLPVSAAVEGSIRFQDENLMTLPAEALRRLRGDQIAFIFQDAGAALNPVIPVGRQVEEVIRAHRSWSHDRVREQAKKSLEQVGVDFSIGEAYPHQLSGGQLQRVQIAQALSCEPALIIADEPASGLDAPAQAGILEMIVRRTKAALLVITHQPSSLRVLSIGAAMLRGLPTRVLVMYAGQVVETGALDQLETSALHPYTQALLSCSKPCGRPGQRQKLHAIEGQPASFSRLSRGCAFEPRCSRRLPVCAEREPQSSHHAGEEIRCFLV